MPLNAFVPIRPIPETSSGYQNYLNWLGNVGSFSNLADSMIYRWVDNPEIRIGYPQEASFHPAQRATHLNTDATTLTRGQKEIDNLVKAEPYVKNIRVKNQDMPQAGVFSMHQNKPAGLARIANDIPVSEMERTIHHEVLGHGTSTIRPEYQENKYLHQEGKQHPDFYDNKTGKTISFQEYQNSPNASDYYKRSTPEIMAESNLVNDRNMATRFSNNNVRHQAVMPNEQIHPIYRNFMQNLSKLGKVASKAGSALGALALPTQVMQGADLYNDIKKEGINYAYAKWLGLNPKRDYQ